MIWLRLSDVLLWDRAQPSRHVGKSPMINYRSSIQIPVFPLKSNAILRFLPTKTRPAAHAALRTGAPGCGCPGFPSRPPLPGTAVMRSQIGERKTQLCIVWMHPSDDNAWWLRRTPAGVAPGAMSVVASESAYAIGQVPQEREVLE